MSEVRIQYQGLDSFVRNLISRVNDPTGNFTYIKLLRLTLSNLGELNLFVVPSYQTIRGAVEDTLTIPLPEDTIRPTAAFIVKKCNGKDVLFRLGKRDRVYEDTFQFANCPSNVQIDDCSTISVFNFYGQELREFYLYNEFYGENYGRRSTRFWGFYSFDAVNNRIELIGPKVGDWILVVSEVANDSCKLIPKDLAPALAYKVLQQHYEGSDVRKSLYMERQFKIHLSEFKRHRQDSYSYEDYLDAITSEYANNVR